MRSRLSVALPLWLSGGALLLGACASGCNGSNKNVACGAGTTLSGKTCVLSNADDEGGTSTLAFAGVDAVAPASPTSIFAAWTPATESGTAAAAMRYLVFVAPSTTTIDYTQPAATTIAGATSFYLTGLDATTTYTVGVRALDPAGNSDSNDVTLSGAPGTDTAAPTFGGVTSAIPGGPGAVVLNWTAASDDHTPPVGIVYFVYVSNQLTSFDYSTPVLITSPGVTSVSVPYLYDPTLVYNFVVRARDAAGNIDSNAAAAASRAGAETTPPQFAGCASAIADSAGSAVLTWPSATDPATPQDLITYDIYDASAPGGFDFSKPTTSLTGTTFAEVTGIAQSTTWHFVVRARNYAGMEDQNLVDCVTTTASDPTPPTFAGLTGAVVKSDARTATFSWAPATDPVTPTSEIVYDVFQGLAPGAEDFTTPIATSAPGATTILVTNLTPDSTLYWVVRARDQAGNRDSNTIEENGVTDVSLSEQVQSVFSLDCAVAGCHVPGDPPLGLVLATGFAYSYTVNVRSREYPSEARVTPGDPTASFLYQKISEDPPPVGYQMPAPATGSVLSQSEIALIRSWIQQGAPNN